MTDKKRRVAERLFGWEPKPVHIGAGFGEELYDELWFDEHDNCMDDTYNTPALFCDAIKAKLIESGRGFVGRYNKDSKEWGVYCYGKAWHRGATEEAAYIEAMCQMIDKEGE